MKKITILLFLIFVKSTILWGQPAFTSNECFQVNDSSKIGFAIYMRSFESFIPQTGSNHIWDFSSEAWTNPTASYYFRPSIQSGQTVFHQTEINEYCVLAFGRDVFYTYSSNDDTLYYDGLYISANYKYAPRVPYLTFPLNYQDSVYTYTKQFANPIQPNNATGSVSRYWIYDGYGSVKLPYGTINDVYRIRTKQVDSSYIINTATPYEEMIWFRKSDGVPVLRFLKNATIITAYFTSTSTLTSISGSTNNSSIIIYPNPFNDKLVLSNFSTEKIKQVFIYDNLGKLVISENSYSDYVDAKALESGFYFAKIVFADNSSVTRKLIKESTNR